MTKSVKSIVQTNFLRFKGYEGSEHIATRSSQENLLKILQSTHPKEVLDFGAGIGTLTALVLDNSEANITAVEKNIWCSDQFRAHILPNNRVTLKQFIPEKKHYDIYIIDDSISIGEVCKIFKVEKKSFIIFIEGRRSSTVSMFNFFQIFYSYSCVYTMDPSRLDSFGNRLSEKAGSHFYFFKTSLMAAISSYFKRFKKTEDLRHLSYYIRITLRKIKFR
jgi:hypothetical protein